MLLQNKLPDAELATVQVLFRHGDRTPISALKNDDGHWKNCGAELVSVSQQRIHRRGLTISRQYEIPGKSQNLWEGNCNVGQLTLKGVQQARRLGRALRNIYLRNKDIAWTSGRQLLPKDIQVRSTDFLRTMQTAQFVLKGLFPTSNVSVPIHVRPKFVDSMDMGLDKGCSRLKELYDTARKESKAFVQYEDESATLASKFNELLESQLSLDKYYDQFLTRSCNEKPLPCSSKGCISKGDVDMTLSLGDWWGRFEFDTSRREEIGLRMQDFLKELQDNSRNDSIPLRLYAAHDTNVMPLLAIFSTESFDWPPYTAHVVVETWRSNSDKKKDQRLVRMLYNGQVLKLKVCGGKTECPWEEWSKGLSQFTSVPCS